MDNIKNKTVLITGAASGIGYKYAEQLLLHGAKCVAILDLPTSPGQRSAETLDKQFGKGKALFFPCDVTDVERFTECFKKVIDTFKVLDIVINNAGMANENVWEKMIALNVNALIRGTYLALDHMGKHKGGRGGTIVNIASIVGLSPFPGLPVYTASKHAVVGFSRTFENPYSQTGVRVLVMCPGVTNTPLIGELGGRVMTFGEEVALDKMTKEYPNQSVDNVGKAMVELIQKGGPFTICVAENEEPPYAINIPHYSKLAVPL